MQNSIYLLILGLGFLIIEYIFGGFWGAVFATLWTFVEIVFNYVKKKKFFPFDFFLFLLFLPMIPLEAYLERRFTILEPITQFAPLDLAHLESTFSTWDVYGTYFAIILFILSLGKTPLMIRLMAGDERYADRILPIARIPEVQKKMKARLLVMSALSLLSVFLIRVF